MTTSAGAPPFIVTCGPPGSGRTTDIVRAVGSSAVFATAEGALKPVEPVLGTSVMSEYPAKTIEDATKALLEIKNLRSNGYKGTKLKWYVADEFSYMADRTWTALEQRLSGFRLWGVMRKVCLDFRDAAREAGVGVIANCWVADPVTKSSGKFVRGGPQLPSDLPEKFPGIADYIFMCVYDAAIQPWPWYYRTEGDNNWALKDRDHKTGGRAPMNLGEILRFAGYAAPYPPALQKIAPSIEALAGDIGPSPIAVSLPLCEDAYQLLIKHGVDPRHAKWAVGDALARAALRSRHSSMWATFAGTSQPTLATL